MIEVGKPMSAGRGPTIVGSASIVTDGGLYPVFITNREVSFPNYPYNVKGYIAEGYGLDRSVYPTYDPASGSVSLYFYDISVRVVTDPGAYYVYTTPIFKAYVVQGDVVDKPWIGVNIGLSCVLTTTVTDNNYVPPVITITTSTNDFAHTFSTDDDPVIGSPDYLPPNLSWRSLSGTEYLSGSVVGNIVTQTEAGPYTVTATTPP